MKTRMEMNSIRGSSHPLSLAAVITTSESALNSNNVTFMP